MRINEQPYFMSNKEWYRNLVEETGSFDPETGRGYVLTDKAPQEAIDSYMAFYKEFESTELE